MVVYGITETTDFIDESRTVDTQCLSFNFYNAGTVGVFVGTHYLPPKASRGATVPNVPFPCQLLYSIDVQFDNTEGVRDVRFTRQFCNHPCYKGEKF
jgi:hypothetical protein